jgi:hypothetical protein
VTLSGVNLIGQTLTADTSAVGGSGAISHQWRADGVNIPGATASTFEITGAQAGAVISCVVTRADNSGSLIATFPENVPFNINFSITGATPEDAFAVAPGMGRAGDSITLTYTLSSGGLNSMLSFAGGTGLAAITAPGSGTVAYTVTPSDAVNGVITIAATFTHTNLTLRTLAFEHGNRSVAFGQPIPDNAVTLSGGTGDITYTSSNADVATITADGTLTVVGVGATLITASVAESDTHSAATASFTLTITRATREAPTGVSGVNQTVAGANDGAITGASSAMEFRLSTDAIYTAATESSVVGLAPGTYHVRFAATATHDASPHVTVVILAVGETHTPPIVRQIFTILCTCCGEITVQVNSTTFTEENPTTRLRTITIRQVTTKRDANGNVIDGDKAMTRVVQNMETGEQTYAVMCFDTGDWIVTAPPPPSA